MADLPKKYDLIEQALSAIHEEKNIQIKCKTKHDDHEVGDVYAVFEVDIGDDSLTILNGGYEEIIENTDLDKWELIIQE